MKHVGKMKNNGAKIAVVFRTLPGDAHSALVVGTGKLGEAYHDALMSVIQDTSGQAANELADILAVRSFPDGSNMLGWLDSRGHLRKVPTADVIMTFTPQSSVPLNELNLLIAKQKGVELEDLAINDGSKPKKPKAEIETVAEISTTPQTESKVEKFELNPAEMRSRADALFKQAQQLRKQADELDPPKAKTKKVSDKAV